MKIADCFYLLSMILFNTIIDFLLNLLCTNWKVSCKYQRVTPSMEALHGKRDTFERDIIIGGSLSFSPIVIFVV